MDKAYNWVYIILCANNNYYTGYTTNLEKRYQAHVDGTSKCKYTRSFKPVRLAQSWQVFGEKTSAMQVERLVKKLSRQDKEHLISNPSMLALLAKEINIVVSSAL